MATHLPNTTRSWSSFGNREAVAVTRSIDSGGHAPGLFAIPAAVMRHDAEGCLSRSFTLSRGFSRLRFSSWCTRRIRKRWTGAVAYAGTGGLVVEFTENPSGLQIPE